MEWPNVQSPGSSVQGAVRGVQGAVCSAPALPGPRLGPPLTSPHLRTAGKFGTPEGLCVPTLVLQLCRGTARDGSERSDPGAATCPPHPCRVC